MKEEVLIGLEIHLELDTKTKLFCGCARSGSVEPNSRTCVVCLGMPGSKPVVNKKAVDYAIKLALATKSKIAPELVFSRKSYFYPDMAKNYQITQYEMPLASGGYIKLDSGKKVNLTRIHMEEDPAAMVHPAGMQKSSYVLVDYNRSGDPLVEVVTEPDMKSSAEAREFMNKLITILSYLDIFNINNCIIKADVNVNIKPYPRVEIKNVTGFKEIQKSIEYELERQRKELKDGRKGKQHTRAWDGEMTFRLREKETGAEYGYIVDPDLTPVELSSEGVSAIEQEMPELADAKLEKFTKEHGITEEMANIISRDKELAEVFESVAKEVNPELASKWIRRELTRVLNYNKKKFSEVKMSEKHLAGLLKLVESKKISERTAQKILEKLVVNPFDVKEHVRRQGLEMLSNFGEIEKMCKEAINENPSVVEDFKAGNEKSLNFLVGQVMRKSKGKASPKEVNETIKKIIG